MGNQWGNLRYAVRVLRRSPIFTCVAVFSLALGIGANTAIFTLINALLLRNLPVRDPERLVEIVVKRQDTEVKFSYPTFRELQKGQRVFSDLFGWMSGPVTIDVGTIASRITLSAVTGNYYSGLGVVPLFGRLLTNEDVNLETDATSQVAVVSYECWQQQFGGVPNIIGKQIRLANQPFTIIGVTRKWFTGTDVGFPPDVTIPITAYPVTQDPPFTLEDRSVLWVSAIGRLKDGVDISKARAQLLTIWPGVLEATVPTQAPGRRRERFLSMVLQVRSAATGIAKDLRVRFTRPLYTLWGIVGIILLVANTNLANLILARAAARAREMGVRVAVGASRGTLIAEVLTETLMVSMTGALLGLGLAYLASALLVRLMTEGFLATVTFDLRPDARVLGITFGVAAATGVFIALIPAWRIPRQYPAFALQHRSHKRAGAMGNLSKALIVAQVALSLVLLLGAGVLLRTFATLRSADLGFTADRLLEISLEPRAGAYHNIDIVGYRRDLLNRLSRVLGVSSVSFSDAVFPRTFHRLDAVVDPATGSQIIAERISVWPSFFATLGIKLLQGRDFDQNDDKGHPPVAIVNATLAKHLFPRSDVIGQHIRFGAPQLGIVGLASDARLFGVRDAAAAIVYVPALEDPDSLMYGELFIRTDGDSSAVARATASEVESMGREYASHINTVEQVVHQSLAEERVTAMLSGFFAGLALLLASIGLYGLTSYAVTQRTAEIGIRMALGAQPERILWTVLRETISLTLLGVAVGIPCAVATTKVIESMLYGVSPSDLQTIGFVSVLLLGIALMAGYLPAQRASRIDPLVALRSE